MFALFFSTCTYLRTELCAGIIAMMNLIYVAAAIASPRLFTTHRKCSEWDAAQWRHLGYRARCINHSRMRRVVRRHCAHEPQLDIQYADIARLLILYDWGGWYVDSDVLPTVRSAKTFSFEETVFGLESNFDAHTAKQMGMLPKSLAMWAIFGLRGDARLKSMACRLAAQSTRPRGVGESLDRYVHTTSGPTAYTELWNGTILPLNVFGCGQQHSGSPECSSSTCWGCHQFEGSWRFY